MVWQWEKINPAHNSTSGDIAKLFKNEAVKQPGVIAAGAPPADATLMAREAIQNSWDAGRQLAADLEDLGEEPPKFRVRFVYRALVGDEKERFVRTLGLQDLAQRANVSAEHRRKLGLAEEDCLSKLHDSGEPLRILELVENGTTGMDGPWTGAASKMYLAMVSVGFTLKAEGAGGSYGYGKSGLIRGSRIRTVIAHTCFRERDDDPGVTRRLLGMTYWGTHDEYTGFARYGRHQDDAVLPMENEDADAAAQKLGIGLRDPATPKELGSTFLLVDPAIEPDDLIRALERNWWPAIMDEECEFDVWVEDEDGHRHVPRPRRDPVLATFIRGYELALSPQDNQHENEFRKPFGTYHPQGGDKRHLGTIGLVADLASWSYAHGGEFDGEESVDHQSLVALVRGPRMVVEYFAAGRSQPFVRGTLLAHSDVDDLLRQTEPKAHDAWLGDLHDDSVDQFAPRYARELTKRLRAAVREFRKILKPPPPKEQDIHLPLLNDLFRSILENRGPKNPPPPPPDPRLIAINVINQHAEPGPNGGVLVRAAVRMHLTDNHAADSAECRAVFRVALDEDGRLGDSVAVHVSVSPAGFVASSHAPGVGTTLTGPLSHGPVEFEMYSDEYDADWTTQLIVSAEPVDEPSADATPSELEVVG